MILELDVKFHEGDDSPLEIETGESVDIAETVCEYWNDMGSDYYNWTLKPLEE